LGEQLKIMNRVLLGCAVVLILASTAIASDLIGEKVGDGLVWGGREQWEKTYREGKFVQDKTIYRLGEDIVLFVEHNGGNDWLHMTSAELFSEHELEAFIPSSARADLPPRGHEMFRKLETKGRRAGFH
jgi:hypothetical protein